MQHALCNVTLQSSNKIYYFFNCFEGPLKVLVLALVLCSIFNESKFSLVQSFHNATTIPTILQIQIICSNKNPFVVGGLFVILDSNVE
jgi:hypothetical protein